MKGRRYPQSRFDGPPSIRDLEEQTGRFRRKVADAQARLDRLKAGTSEFNRPMGRTHSITAAEEDLAGAVQGLRNAERILTTARELRGQEGPCERLDGPVTGDR